MIYIAILMTAFMICKLSLDVHQINYIKNLSISEEEMDKLNVDQNFIDKSNSYGLHKLYLSTVSTLITLTFVFFVLLLDGFNKMYFFSEYSGLSVIGTNLATIITFYISFSIINAPLSYLKTFYIEEKFGFNQMTKELFVKDTLITTALSLIIISIIFKLFEILFTTYTEFWWFYLWIMFILLNLVIAYVYPSLIAPIFNKFEKLNDDSLNSSIYALTDKLNFPINDLYVMDGSKRSSHSNAYFSGLFGKKRIVFFDTLLKVLTTDEIRSVLAHEIGHYKKNHIFKSTLLFSFISLIFLYAFYIFFNILSFEIKITSDLQSSFVAILFILISPMLSFFLSPLLSAFSRKNEFQADDYAKTHTDSKDLISSLLKLSKGNLSLVKSSPIYSNFYSSHPSVFDRINNLLEKKDE